MLVVVQECPELFKPVHLPCLVILKRVGLEFLVDLWSKLLLETVAEKPEQALQSISVSNGCVLPGQSLEFLIHLFVEVLSQEVGPKSVHRVHFLRLSNAHSLTLFQASGVVL